MPNPTAKKCATQTLLALCGVLTLSLSTLSARAQTVKPLPLPIPTETEQQQDPPLTPPLPTTDDLNKLAPVTGEIRAMWVVRDSMTSPQKVRNVISLAKKYGFNTLFVQVRGRGDAFYQSRFEPRSEELADQPADFDPLALAVDEGHKAGLEVHAWMNTFLVWSKGRRPYSSRHIINQHPEWLVQDKQQRCRTTPNSECEGGFLDPAIPDVREYTKNVFLDVALRYPVDGIHFDYVRYPCNGYSFSQYDMKAFREYMTEQLSENDVQFADAKARKNRLAWFYLYPNQWREWRMMQVGNTVRDIADTARQTRPELIVSAAVFPNYSVASEDKGQAWRNWLRDGVLDAVCPMTYNRNTEVVGAQVRAAIQNSYGRPVVPGVGAYQMSADSAIAKALVCRQLGASGLNFFSYDGMTREGRTEAYLAKVCASVFKTPTLPPNWRRPIATAQKAVPTPADVDSNALSLRPGR